MDKSHKEELANYQFQHGQILEALEKDPDNSELLKLKSDLDELITLYTQLVQQEPEPPKKTVKRPAPPPSTLISSKEEKSFVFHPEKKSKRTTLFRSYNFTN